MSDKLFHADKPLVLVIDDDFTVNSLVETAMVRNGFKPICAHSGDEGLELARICLPKAIILDWMMPEMDGIEVLTHLKSDPKTADIPVIMLTGKRMSEDVLEAIQNGAAEYVVKPFEMTEFIVRFKKTLMQFSNHAENDPSKSPESEKHTAEESAQ